MVKWTTLGMALALTAAPAWARAPKVTKALSHRSEAKEAGAKPILAVTMRPTWYQSEATFEMQNTVEAGIQFHPNFGLSYVQDFNTNRAASGRLSEAGDFTPTPQDGFFRFRFSNLHQSDDKLFTYSYQLRAYLPTEPNKHDAGFITMIRNYFIFDRKISEALGFTFYEVPILHLYDRDGSTNAKGEAVANPIFENRVILEPTIKLGSSVTLGLPLNFYLLRYREFANSKLSGEWVPVLTFSPWIEWAVAGPLTLGFYYETASVAEKTEAGTVWADGQRSGYYQAYLRIAL